MGVPSFSQPTDLQGDAGTKFTLDCFVSSALAFFDILKNPVMERIKCKVCLL